jgi:TRAP transporter TAXI family solute receptor
MTATQITYKIVFPILLAFALLLYFISGFIEPAPKKELTIATGGKSQSYYNTALKYKKLLEEQNVKLNIISTSGSVENLKLLKEKKVDIAFVQGGIASSSDAQELESLASVYYEPLWIFYKNRGYKMEYLLEFIDKKIAIGSNGSGTQHLTKQILRDNGISKENTTLLPISLTQAKDKLISGEIDALFSVTSLDSPAVVELLADPSIEILNIKRIQAYNQKYTFLSALKLYEGTVNMFLNIPSEDKNILSTTANLVCKKGLNDELVRIFMKQVKKVHYQKSIFSKENQFPSLHHLDIPINKEAQKYILKGDSWLESIFPFWIATQIDRLKILLIPFLTLLFPLIKGILPLYKWSIRSKIYKWYEELEELEYREGQTVVDLNKNLLKIEALKLEVNEQIKVPLSYKGEYYNLILHLNLVSKELRKQINIMKKEEK